VGFLQQRESLFENEVYPHTPSLQHTYRQWQYDPYFGFD